MLSFCACRLSILDLAVPWAACRFEPTCSEYASALISRYGVLRRRKLASCRFLKCYPFHPRGMDPVK